MYFNIEINIRHGTTAVPTTYLLYHHQTLIIMATQKLCNYGYTYYMEISSYYTDIRCM